MHLPRRDQLALNVSDIQLAQLGVYMLNVGALDDPQGGWDRKVLQ